MRKASLLLSLLLVPALVAAQDAPSAGTAGAPRVRVVTSAGNFVIEKYGASLVLRKL